MNKLYVDSFVEKKIQSGIQLLDKNDFRDLMISDQLIHLYDKSNHFLATAYLSHQNKGIGWVLSSEKIK